MDNLKPIIFLPALAMAIICIPLVALSLTKKRFKKEETKGGGKIGETETREDETGKKHGSVFEKKVEPKILTIVGAISIFAGFISLITDAFLHATIPLFEIILPFIIFGVIFLLFGLISHFGTYIKNSKQEFN